MDNIELQGINNKRKDKNLLNILKIKMPMNMVKYEFKDSNGETLNMAGFASAGRFVATIEDIPSYLIKKIEFTDLDWNSDDLAIATVYCYQPLYETIFSAKEYEKKWTGRIYEISVIKEYQDDRTTN